MSNRRILQAIYILVGINLLLGFFWWRNQASQDGNSSGNYKEVLSLSREDMSFGDLSKFFTALAQDKGGGYAYRALAYATTHALIPANIDTHLLGHVVGDELFKQKGIDGMGDCTDDMRNACSHSIVVGGLLAEGVSAIGQMVEACHGAPGGKGAYRMCVHGLGHGVLAYANYDMRKAVELCKPTATSLDYNNMEFTECIGGISMEMMAGVNDKEMWEKEKPNYFKASDPLSPCDMDFIPTNTAHICYNFLTPHLFVSAGANLAHPDPTFYAKAFSFCEKIPVSEKRNRSSCFGGFGKEFVVLANYRNVQSVESMGEEQLRNIYDWCRLATKEGINPCLDSALQSLFWGGENKRDVAVGFCRVMKSESDQTFCFQDLIGAVAYYIDDSRYHEEFCHELPDRYQNQCLTQLLKTS